MIPPHPASRSSLALPSPSDVSTSTSAHVRCPRCDAQVRVGSDWCTLCYADLRPSSPAPEPVVDPVDGPVTGKHARRTKVAPPAVSAVEPAPGPVPEGAITAMLAQLAAESAVPLGRFARHLDSPGRKISLMVGGTVVATIVVVVLMTLVGVLL